MKISQEKITIGLSARAESSDPLDTAIATIGTQATYAPTAAATIYSVTVAATAMADMAVLTPATAHCVDISGAPVISSSGVDFQGVNVAVQTKIHGLRITMPTSNVGPVSVVGADADSLLPSLQMFPGTDLGIKYPNAGQGLAEASTITFEFLTEGDSVTIAFLGAP